MRTVEFLALFLEDVGRRPSPAHKLRRIHLELGYSPKNCKWMTDEDLQCLRSDTKARGHCITMDEWAREISSLTGGEKTPADVLRELRPLREDEDE
jgi:hypothetical protein